MTRNPLPLGFLREKTRVDLVKQKIENAITLPVIVASVNFQFDGNLGYLIRSAACFGATEVFVIGNIPAHRELHQLSCGTSDFLTIRQFHNPNHFLSYIRENDIHLVSLEMCEQAVNLTDYRFPMDRKVCIVTGNETTGVPVEIIMNSDCLYIPIPGCGPCLNTAMAANIALYEYVRQIYCEK